MRARAVFTPDAARNGNQVILRACPGRMGSPRFRRRLIGFRRFSNGSLALAFPHRACRDLVSTFLQRSPPSLFTTAACSGLKPAPDRRLRGAHPHLSYSIAPPYVGTFVTHSHNPTLAVDCFARHQCPLLENAAIALQQGHVAMGQLRTRAGAACSDCVIKTQSKNRSCPHVDVVQRTNDALSTNRTLRWTIADRQQWQRSTPSTLKTGRPSVTTIPTIG